MHPDAVTIWYRWHKNFSLEHPLAPVRVLLGPWFTMLGPGTPFDNAGWGGGGP